MLTQNEEDMKEGSTSPMQHDNVTKSNPLAIVPVPRVISHITSRHSKINNKRIFFDAMETEN